MLPLMVLGTERFATDYNYCLLLIFSYVLTVSISIIYWDPKFEISFLK